MATVEISVVVRQLVAVLHEAFEGPPQRWSYFTDQGPEAGLLGTLATLGPEDASRITNNGGRTIAAHVYHVIFAMNASAAWIRGDRTPHNWKESWRLSTVDELAWPQLLEDLRLGYKDLHQAIESQAASSEEAVGGAVGAIAHVAYHLGAIRQKRAFLRSPETR